MRTLHEAAPTPIVVVTTGAPMPADGPGDAPVCPDCQHQDFVRIEWGNYSERHSVDFSSSDYPRENWDNNETECMGSEPWKCWNCDRQAPDWLQDLIEDSR